MRTQWRGCAAYKHSVLDVMKYAYTRWCVKVLLLVSHVAPHQYTYMGWCAKVPLRVSHVAPLQYACTGWCVKVRRMAVMWLRTTFGDDVMKDADTGWCAEVPLRVSHVAPHPYAHTG